MGMVIAFVKDLITQSTVTLRLECMRKVSF